MSETFYSGTQYYMWKCTDSLHLPVTQSSVIINTYNKPCSDNPVAFSAFVEGQCINHYGDSSDSSASYSCDTDEGHVPVKTYFTNSKKCEGKSQDIMLPEECSAEYTYDANPLEKKSSSASSSSSSYYYYYDYMYSYYNYDIEDIGLYTRAYCPSSDKDTLSGGEIAGIVIAVLITCAVASYFAFRYYRRSVAEKSLRELLNDNSSPNRQYPQPGSGHHEDIIIEENKSKNPMQL